MALMGQDYPAFLRESRRVLKLRGYAWVAEVRSRFVPPNDAKEDFAPFLEGMAGLGFKVLKQDLSNKMFVVWVFQNVGDDADDIDAILWPALKPCIYKRR